MVTVNARTFAQTQIVPEGRELARSASIASFHRPALIIEAERLIPHAYEAIGADRHCIEQSP